MGLILAERQRQTMELGYDSAHDDQHKSFELSKAAECYRAAALTALDGDQYGGMIERGWPWTCEFKPKPHPLENLAIAGALFLAEMMRLRRLPDRTLSNSYQARVDEVCEQMAKVMKDEPIPFAEAKTAEIEDGPMSCAVETIDEERSVTVCVNKQGQAGIVIRNRDLNGQACVLDFCMSVEGFAALERAINRIRLYQLER